MSSELFFEIGMEEMPPSFIPAALEHFRTFLGQHLTDHLKLSMRGVEIFTFGTPRRLTLAAQGLPASQPDQSEELMGPPVSISFDREGVPTKAALGFAKSQGVEVGALTRKDTPKGQYLCVLKRTQGQPLVNLMPEVLAEMLRTLALPKAMRWGSGEHLWVRPVHWVVAMLDGAVLPFTFAGIEAGAYSYGHRLMSPKRFKVGDLVSYLTACRRHKVIPHLAVDERLKTLSGIAFNRFPGRREMIEAGLAKIAAEQGATVFGMPGTSGEQVAPELREHYYTSLLEEVCHLTEYPVPTLGSFSSDFLRLPKEVILSELREHQRCFALLDGQGKLLPNFISVANNDYADSATVRKGNERVIRARLSDASFFFDSDCQVPPKDLLAELKGVIFHRQIGTIHEKVERMARLAIYIGSKLDFCDPTAANDQMVDFVERPLSPQTSRQSRMKWLVARAAMLSKADLVSFMVGEFPELQGIMGREYTRLGGEPEEISLAVEDHYHPRFAGDTLPRNLVGSLVSMADKLDTICAIIGIGKPPTGSADPFALRRCANGVLRICIEQELKLDLGELVKESLRLLAGKVTRPAEQVAIEVLDFFGERFRHGHFMEPAAPTEVINAVLAARFDRPLDAHMRVIALTEVYQRPDFMPVAITFKRVMNIIKDGAAEGPVERALFRSDEEGRLHAATSRVERQITDRLGQRTVTSYRSVLTDLAAFKPEVDHFFDAIMVNCEEEPVRLNRHRLLRDVASLFMQVADFSELHVT